MAYFNRDTTLSQVLIKTFFIGERPGNEANPDKSLKILGNLV